MQSVARAGLLFAALVFVVLEGVIASIAYYVFRRLGSLPDGRRG